MEWAREIVEQYGYWAVFVGTFIEGESVFIAAAALTAGGLLDPYALIAVAAGGAFIGHLFFFAVGRFAGQRLFARFPALARHRHHAEKIFNDHAAWSVFIFQYLYGTRIVAAILFGTSGIAFWRFFLLQIANCLSWAVVIYLAGRLLGMAAMLILEEFGLIGLLVAVIAAGLIAVIGFHRIRRHKHVTDEHRPSP